MINDLPKRGMARGSRDLGGDQSPSHSTPKHTVCDCVCDCDCDFVWCVWGVVSGTEVLWI